MRAHGNSAAITRRLLSMPSDAARLLHLEGRRVRAGRAGWWRPVLAGALFALAVAAASVVGAFFLQFPA